MENNKQVDIFSDINRIEEKKEINKNVKKINIAKGIKIANKVLFLWKVFKEMFIIYLIYKTLFNG